jgi:hypothetical protein
VVVWPFENLISLLRRVGFCFVYPEVFAVRASACGSGTNGYSSSNRGRCKMKWAVIVLGCVILLSGCGHRSSNMLINPTTGQIIRCQVDSYGWGLAGVIVATQAAQATETCKSQWKEAGYIEIDKVGSTGAFLGKKAVERPLEPAIIEIIKSGSPADRAGVKVGDRIIERDGKSVSCCGDLMQMGTISPGQQIRYKVQRGEQTLTFNLIAVPLRDLIQTK